jgi:hypothetical protein
MKVLAEQKNHIVQAVRETLAADPLISIRRMQQMVEIQTGRSVSDKYLSKLLVDIRQDAVANSDPNKVRARMEAMRARYEPLTKNLLTIAWSTKGVAFKERLATIKTAAHLDLMLLRAEIYTGAFDKQGAVVELKERATFSRSIKLRN